MPANVDSMFSVRERPWHNEGVILDDHPKSIEEALHLSGLDWEVDIFPIYLDPIQPRPSTKIPGYMATVRTDTNAILGIVGERFTPVQNIEAFQFLDNLLGTDMLFETAGSLGIGERTWVLSKIPDYITVGGDHVDQFVLFSNGHNGKNAVQVLVTPVRVVCQNTLSLAIGKAPNKYSIRHTTNASVRLSEARDVLQISVDYGKQFKQIGDDLASQKMTDKKLAEIIEELYPAKTERAESNQEHIKSIILDLHRNGQTAGNSPGSKWSALNAICEYSDHYRPTRGDSNLFARANFEPTNPKQKAYDLIVN